MDAGRGNPDLWQRLGRFSYDRRRYLRLTQKQLADLAGVSLGTITRLETAVPSTRRAASWPKIESALGWPQGFIEDFITGKVLGPPVTEPDDDRYTRQPKDDFTEIIRDVVRQVTVEVAPGTPLSVVIEMEERAIAHARERGYIGPTTTADDVDGTTTSSS